MSYHLCRSWLFCIHKHLPCLANINHLYDVFVLFPLFLEKHQEQNIARALTNRKKLKVYCRRQVYKKEILDYVFYHLVFTVINRSYYVQILFFCLFFQRQVSPAILNWLPGKVSKYTACLHLSYVEIQLFPFILLIFFGG